MWGKESTSVGWVFDIKRLEVLELVSCRNINESSEKQWENIYFKTLLTSFLSLPPFFLHLSLALTLPPVMG